MLRNRSLQRFALAVSLLIPASLTSQSAQAAEHQFPYQAVVIGDEVDVRCGPGMDFYVTNRLNAETVVTVHRHDHGGWYMIAPPEGSISWIEAEIVERTGGGRGRVTINAEQLVAKRGFVWIGSTLSDDHAYYGRELVDGDEVEILGEKTLNGRHGPVAMLKIKPPKQEFRWVKGEFLVPMNDQVRRQLAANPYEIPPSHRKRLADTGQLPAMQETHTLFASVDVPGKPTREPLRTANADTQSDDTPRLPAPASESSQVAESTGTSSDSTVASMSSLQGFDRLNAIDQRYQAMMQRPPKEWNLAPIEADYRRLRPEVPVPVASMIDERLELVARRREIAEHYQAFVRISAETARRDAALLAQRDGEVAQSAATPAPQIASNLVNSQLTSSPLLTQTPTQESLPSPADAPQWNGATTHSNASNHPQKNGGISHISGAGILQEVRSNSQLPPFQLVAPDGRLLAFVEPEGEISLSEWVGQAAGLTGKRQFDPRLNAEVIRATSAVPVRLLR